MATYAVGSVIKKVANDDDNNWTLQTVYIHDESDISYRELSNRTDGAIKREHAIRYAEKIKKMRAEKERAAALDAFNYLNGKHLSLEQ